MKIAFDAQSLFEEKKTGIGYTVEKIIENMDIQGDEFQLNYFLLRNKKEKRKLMEKYAFLGYKTKECTFFPLGIYRRIWHYLPIPYSFFMGKKAQITQFFNFIIPPGVKGKKAVYIYDMVYQACAETMERENFEYMERNMEETAKRADFIITISEFSKREIVKYLQIPEDKIYVVPCGVDLERYNCDKEPRKIEKVKEKFKIKSSYYLYLGTLEPRKNIPAIIEAYWRLKSQSESPIPQLVIAGKKGWNYEKIFELTEKYGLTEDVIFTGYIDEEEKCDLLKGALCFIFPSLYEGFGLPPLEAMACGTPVIVSDRASLPEVVGDAGILVDAYDYDELAMKMKLVFESPEYRDKLIHKGIDRVQDFTWKRASHLLKEVYKKECGLNDR